MKIPSKIRFADERIRRAFEELSRSNFEDRRLLKSLTNAFDVLKQNAFAGIQEPKCIIPKEYSRKYGIDNLWKYNLPGAWRLVYSVGHEGIIVVSIIIEWFKHKEYSRKFKYKE